MKGHRLPKLLTAACLVPLVVLSAQRVAEAPDSAALLEEARVASPLIVNEDFEDAPERTFTLQYTRDAASHIASARVTDEDAFSGRQCYRVQVRMGPSDPSGRGHGTFYLLMPFEIPAWTDVRLTLHVKVDAPVPCPIATYHGFSTGDAEESERGHTGKGLHTATENGWERWEATMTGGRLGAYVEGVALRLSMKGAQPGALITLYVDDITIETRLPSTWREKWQRVFRYYTQEVDTVRQAQARQRIGGIQGWWKDCLRRHAELPPTLPGAGPFVEQQYQALLQAIRNDTDAIPELVDVLMAYLQGETVAQAPPLVAVERRLIRLARNQELAAAYAPYVETYKELDLLTFVLDPTQGYPVLPQGPMAHTLEDSFYTYTQKGQDYENPQILPTTSPLPAYPGRTLRGFGCRDTFVPLSFGVASSQALERVTISASDLRSVSGDTIPADAIDTRVVAAWYRPFGGRARLMNELLLHDPEFVVPDLATQTNRFRDRRYGSDAETLQPLDVPAGTARQFYSTIKIPASARAGRYTGTLVAATKGLALTWNVELDVMPFDLLPTPNAYSAYYRTYMVDEDRKRSLGNHSFFKTVAQIRNELINMGEHGLNVLNYYGGKRNLAEVELVLGMAMQAGLTRCPWIWLGHSVPTRPRNDYPGAPDTKQKVLASIAEQVPQMAAFLRERGYPQVAYYGADELSGAELIARKDGYDAVNRAGGLIACACMPGYYDEVQSAISVPIVYRGAHSKQARDALRRTQADGHEFWIYNCPVTCMPASPSAYRRRYGLAMWRNGENGAIPWQYGGASKDQRTPAYVFDYKQELAAFTYPTWNGRPIDTVIYEAFREGIYDTRYMATLEASLRQARAVQRAAELVAAVEVYLAEISVHDNPQTVRRCLADFIITLAQQTGIVLE